MSIASPDLWLDPGWVTGMKLVLTLVAALAVGFWLDGPTGAGWCAVLVGGLWIMAYLVDFPG
jgi:hypothetical protein